jgi:hypothetical protein
MLELKYQDLGDAIFLFENFMPDEYCDDVWNYFFENIENAANRQNVDGNHIGEKNDLCINLNNNDLKKIFLNDFFNKAYAEYARKYFVLGSHPNHSIKNWKIQYTKKSQGYHVWHCENYFRCNKTKNRLMTYALFLNDVNFGGELEFLNQALRINPKKGSLIIFPAFFTHIHRGNPPISNHKMIMTGWVEIVE